MSPSALPALTTETRSSEGLPYEVGCLKPYSTPVQNAIKVLFQRSQVISLVSKDTTSEHVSPRDLLEYCQASNISDAAILDAADRCNGDARMIIQEIT